MDKPMNFTNKIIWITGASSGIGAELALQLAQKKARLILTARSLDKLTNIRQQCLAYTQDCEILIADLSMPDANEKVAGEAIKCFGKIDIVILNAGVTQRSLATETSLSVYRSLMEINFFSPLIITKKLLPLFQQQASGQIVVVSSMAGLMGFPRRTGYAAAKHALMGFFETLQTENNIPGLAITIVSPGRINTPISLSALTYEGKAWGRADAGQLKGIPVAQCAAKILEAVARKKKHVTIARGERLLWWIRWYLPALYYRVANKKGMKN